MEGFLIRGWSLAFPRCGGTSTMSPIQSAYFEVTLRKPYHSSYLPLSQVDPTLVPEWLKGNRRKDKEDEPALL